ncbi:MAG: CoA transferase [Acidimicrobiaceae bacterium]|nr:CoA transferase [Acidimicrobiaceae bacterium]MYG55265.1 CoA transferase [Acidimicrobiaceae bacterium]MYJ99659.1 CoA transferase [Acidimicrobiaceae bacterium]
MEPLDHLRVVDTTTDVAGPYASKLFVDAGAEVIKVEPTGGDPARRYSAVGARFEGDSALFGFLNAKKRSIVGTITDPAIEALLEGADLLIESGTVDVESIRARYSHLVVLSITPFGLTGPYASRPATEFTIQAESGSIQFRGRPEREPLTAAGRLAEFMGGAFGGPPALAAVLRARRTGSGEHIDLSMTDVVAATVPIFSNLLHQLSGEPELTTPARSMETPSIEMAKDGYIGFNTNTGEMFERFLVLIERPDLLKDKELLFQWDRSRRDDWPEIMGSWLREHDVDEIVERASELRIPVTPVYDGETIVNNEHLAERGVFVANPGGFTQPRRPFRIDEQDTPRPQPAPAIDADRDSIAVRPTPTPTEPDADRTALPLVGLRVLDLTAWWAGPAATNMLASLGAEVIHVEGTSHPDGVRMTGFLAGTDPWWEASHVFLGANTNKLSITLDLSSDEGRAIVEDLIRWADVVAENFSPRVMENWGLDRETLQAINPRAVFTRMPAFGTTGSWRDRVGFAQTMEQMTMASITGYPDDAPLIPKGPCDPIAGVHGAWAMLVALVQRERSGGEGVFVESTMIEAALNACPLPLLEFSAYGEVMARSANRSITSAPQGVYRCADEETWLAVGVETDEQWRALIDALGSPEWAGDAVLATHEGRAEAHDRIDDALAVWASTRDVFEAAERLCAAGVPAGVCWDPRVLDSHPQLEARGLFEEVAHTHTGTHRIPGLPFRFASVDRWIRTSAPTFGQDNHQVLGDLLGFDAERLAQLTDARVIADRPAGF